MWDALLTEIIRNGDKAALFPVSHLQDLKQDVVELKDRNELNHFQRFIVDELYRLDEPQDFKATSILIVASPQPSVLKLVFTLDGKRIPAPLPASYADKFKSHLRIEGYVQPFLTPRNYRIAYAPQLPHKLSAVRSGLARYGRCNVTFVEGFGSFINLNTFFTDVPCPQDPWREIRAMDACKNCQACLKACPTGAILPQRFLIDNQRCLTYFNEAGGEYSFPEWMDPAVHHTLYGCLRCQMICPANAPYSQRDGGTVEFGAEETVILMQGKSLDCLPENLRLKVERLEMAEYLSAIPRNLRALAAKSS